MFLHFISTSWQDSMIKIDQNVGEGHQGENQNGWFLDFFFLHPLFNIIKY